MFEMTEALIHHARVCILGITNADPDETNQELRMAQVCAYNAGYRAFRFGVEAKAKPSHLPEMLIEDWLQGHGHAEDEENFRAEMAEYKLMYPDSPEERMLYCPSGHNVVWTKAHHDECGACGQIMTENAEDSYYAALIRAGQCM